MISFFEHFIHEFQLPLRNPVLIFSLILFIILLSPIILRRLNIPAIIGLIIAGVAVGPHGFNFLDKTSAIDLFSTIGLLYIMFIAGLELDMNEFKSNRNKSLIFGFYTFIIPLLIGFPVCYYLLGYDFNASFLTASMFSTHTLVAYPIVSKLGISKSPSVAIAVGGTILTDTAVLIILAVIIGNSQGELNQEFWWRLGLSLAIFSAIMFAVIPRIAKWFFSKLESEKHSHYIFVLSVVFFAAFLAEVAGVEPIIGAFVAGLALNKLIPHSSPLMNRIEFIGNSLFIPFFLISVGMLVDIRVILGGKDALMVAFTLSAVALIGKWLAAWLTQKSFGFTGTQRRLIFGLSSAHAAATLAIILVGYKAGILDESILNGTIILILITCLVATFATEKAAKKLVIESDGDNLNTDETTSIEQEHILLPIIDISKMDRLLELAVFLKEKKSTNPISILSVVSNNDEAEMNILKTRKKLEDFVRQASASETKTNIITTIDHNAASGITRISREIMADMILLGWPQRSGLLDKIIGEKIDGILNNTDKTTFICHLEKPLVLHKRMVLLIPPLAEHESGFSFLLSKVFRLANELSTQSLILCNDDTKNAIESWIKRSKTSSTMNFEFFEDWEDFLIIAGKIQENDLMMVVSARKGAASYMSVLENIPAKLEKYFENNRIVIYPQQFKFHLNSDQYGDISSEPINKGLEAVQKLGRELGHIFKKNPEE